MPTLRRRNLTSGEITWDIRYYQNGGRKSHNIGRANKRKAEEIYHIFCVDFSQGRIGDPRLSDLAEWTRLASIATKRPTTVEREQVGLKNFIDALGDIFIKELDHSIIDKYTNTRLSTCAKSTVNVDIQILNTALKQVYNNGNLPMLHGPFNLVPAPTKKVPVYIQPDQIQKLLSTDDQEFKRYLQLLLYTGIRRNEALQLVWDDIDLSLNQITIRKVVINSSLKLILEQWNDNQTGRLFPNYSTNQISMKFMRWVRQLELPDNIKLHSIRASFACHLLSNDVDIYTISQLLGHTSVKVTEKYYLALDQVKARDAVDQLRFDGSVYEVLQNG